MIAEAIVGKIVDAAVSNLLQKIDFKELATGQVNPDASRESMRQHVRMIARWADEISFKDMGASRRLSESFVDLDLHLGFARTPANRLSERPFRVSDIPDLPGNLIILGDPGAGKTTSLKRVAISLLDWTAPRTKHVPLLIRLREIENKDDSLTDVILRVLGVTLTFATHLKSQDKESIGQRVVIEELERFNGILLIDGLDELHPEHRKRIVADLRAYLLHVSGARIILTCRTGDFTYQMENARVLMLNPLTDEQITTFATRWLGSERAPDFLAKVRGTPYAGSEVRPLTLAHLCAIYERIGTVPEKPRTIYRKIVRLLLEDWDEQRSVQRHSRYADFEVDRKEDFLKAVAFQITSLYSRATFSHRELEKVYNIVYPQFGLPAADAAKVMREIESHTGLIVESAYDSYEFAHKSLQEYLTAEYLLKLPHTPPMLASLPNEAAMAVALSSDPTYYFVAVANLLTRTPGLQTAFTEPFLSRLLLEKVDFIPSAELGIVVLTIFSQT